jgi:hypothetical protein
MARNHAHNSIQTGNYVKKFFKFVIVAFQASFASRGMMQNHQIHHWFLGQTGRHRPRIKPVGPGESLILRTVLKSDNCAELRRPGNLAFAAGS